MQAPQANPFQLNAAARLAVLGQSIEMVQEIFSETRATPGSTNNVFNVIPRNVGLIKKFIVQVDLTIQNNTGGATAITPTVFGAANALSQIVFNDLNNNVRINTAGWHLNAVNSAKQQRPFGAAVTSDITGPIDYGSNWNVISATASIADTASGSVRMIYEVPLAYMDDDLRGAVYANVVNATMNLQLTVNPNPVGATANSTFGNIYQAAAGAGAITSVTIRVYQVYLDQLPVGKNGPVLPLLDLSTVYELKNTTFSGIVVNQDFPMAYSNFRQFLSTSAVYQNGTSLGVGADIAYWSLQSANFTNIFKYPPTIAALLGGRKAIMDDWPNGLYYFSHRRKPVDTIQYGNMQLVLNASTVNANAAVQVGYEDFAMLNTISGAGSLAAG